MQIAARKVGMVQVYTGTDGSGSGWLDDFDGKWVYLSLNSVRTIGSSGSGASITQNWALSLFTHIWNRYTASVCPILDSAGAASTKTSAAADWAANKRITLPDFRGRCFVGAGTGTSLTNRVKGFYAGTEAVVLGVNEMPSHSHTIRDGYTDSTRTSLAGIQTNQSVYTNSARLVNATGGGAAHENMQPSAFEHFLIAAGAR